MIERLSALALLYRKTTLGFVLLFCVVFAIVGSHLKFDALPDVTGQQVIVLTRAPGFPPEEVERLVTRPVEMALGGLPGAISQRSISRYALSSVTVVFAEGYDLLRARQLVQERLMVVGDDLAEGIEDPELGPLTGGLGEIYQFAVTSESRTPTELTEIVQYQISPLLRSVPGIVEVNTWGGRLRTWDVIADPLRMSQKRVTLSELGEALRASGGQVPGGTIERGSAGVLLRGIAWPRNQGELGAQIVRKNPEGTVIRVGDVADVVEGVAPRIGAASMDGKGEVVFVMAQMLQGENALEVLSRVRERMDVVRRTVPSDVKIETVYDRGELVGRTLETVFKSLLEGGVLVVGILFLTLGSFRAGALVAAMIPLSMLGAIGGMVFLGLPGNLMSLGALDFGLLVDGAVVLVEGTFLAITSSARTVRENVAQATRELARPVFISVLMILLVYVPLLGLSGVEGRMFRPMTVTVVLALCTAILLSLTFIPAAMSVLLRRKDVPLGEPWLVRRIEHLYAPMLRGALAHPRRLVALALVLSVFGVTAFVRSGTAFVPQLEEGDLVVQTTRASDIRLETAVVDNLKMERAILAAVPEVEHIVTRIGSPAVATDIMGVEQADVFIDLVEPKDFRPGVTKAELIAQIDKQIALSAPPEEVGFTQPIQMRFNELLGGSVADVTLSIFGPDLKTLGELEKKAIELLKAVPGAEDVRSFSPPSVSQLEVRPRALALARIGMTGQELLNHVSAFRVGVPVGFTYDGPVRIPLRLRMGEKTDALSIEQALIPTSEGALLALHQFAEVTRDEGASVIHHESGERRSLIGLNVRGRDLGSVVAEAQASLGKSLQKRSGYRLVWGGQYESLQSAKARLFWLVPVILLGLFLLLLFLFRDVRAASLILLNVPFSVVGGLLSLYARGLPISMSAAIGFVALSGIAVLNGVVLITGLLRAMDDGMDARSASESAAMSRLRPVTMTALVAMLGFVPMMLAQGAGGEVQRPLATVVVGGLFTSTILTLLILPALSPWVFRSRGKPESQEES